jgi:hypothetical protein
MRREIVLVYVAVYLNYFDIEAWFDEFDKRERSVCKWDVDVRDIEFCDWIKILYDAINHDEEKYE